MIKVTVDPSAPPNLQACVAAHTSFVAWKDGIAVLSLHIGGSDTVVRIADDGTIIVIDIHTGRIRTFAPATYTRIDVT